MQPMPLNEIIELANVFQASGIFKDMQGAAQFIVKIQAGQELGIPPFQAITGIHVIQGKPSLGSGILASRVKGYGKYDYEVLYIGDDYCELEFFENKGEKKPKSLGKSKFTVADAQKADVKNMGKYPRNMLFARAMSNGIKWYTPDIYSGPVYTHGELTGTSGEETEDVASEVTTAPVGTSAATAAPMAAVPPAPKPEGAKLPVLTADHPDWKKIIDYLKSGATIDSLRVRFTLSPEVVHALQTAVNPGPVTQEQVHANNAGYTAPSASAEDLTTEPF
jgi:hypothetical protein